MVGEQGYLISVNTHMHFYCLLYLFALWATDHKGKLKRQVNYRHSINLLLSIITIDPNSYLWHASLDLLLSCATCYSVHPGLFTKEFNLRQKNISGH
jgi:hypothetical protein